MRARISLLLWTALTPLLTAHQPAQAQESDNEAIAAAKKAALTLTVTGTAPVKPTDCYARVSVYAEGKGRAQVRAEYQRSTDALRAALEKAKIPVSNPSSLEILRRISENSYQSVDSQTGDGPDDVFKVTSSFALPAMTAEQMRDTFRLLRATGASGTLTVTYGVRDEEAARHAALRAAIIRAKQRVQVLSEAAKPQTFELVYLKEGNFQIYDTSTSVDLGGTEPLRLLTTVGAEANLTLFYGFKAGAAKTAPAKTAPAKKL